MKKLLKKATLPLLLFGVCCMGSAAAPDDLSDDDAGQLLFRKRDGEIFVFRKKTPKNLWSCSVFRNNGSAELDPEYCVLLEFHEDSVPPEAVAFLYAYCSGRQSAGIRPYANAFRNLAERINAMPTANVLMFESSLEKDMKNLAAEIKEFRENEAREKQSRQISANNTQNAVVSLTDSLLVQLETSAAIAMVNDICSKEQNFFIAYCLWERFYDLFNRRFTSLSAGELRSLNEELNKTGEAILTGFQQYSASQRKRCTDFKNICPRKYGPWDYVPPRNRGEMHKRIDSCFRAWRKLQSCSAFSEFPDWGNAALEVMQMVHSPEVEQKFDAAFRNYQKNMNH